MVCNLILKGVTGLAVLLQLSFGILNGNNTFALERTGIPYCEIGQKYYNTDKKKCKRCPKCPKAPDFQNYPINVSEMYGALDCYPCYCKPEKKAHNPETGRCEKCYCNQNGQLNKTVPILRDQFKGGLNCYECNCLPNHFSNYRTQYQCVKCNDCSMKNRLFKQKCSPDKDVICGECLEGFLEPRFDNLACVENTTKVISTYLEQSTPIQENEPLIEPSPLIIAVNLIICIFIFCGVFYIVYKRKQLPCNRKVDSPSVFTSSATMSVRSLNKEDFQTATPEPDSGAHLPDSCVLRINSLQEGGENCEQLQLLTSPGYDKITVVTKINHADCVQIGNCNNYNCSKLLPS